MERQQIPDKLKRARRALDSLFQVEIIDDWIFDKKLKIWFLHIRNYFLQGHNAK